MSQIQGVKFKCMEVEIQLPLKRFLDSSVSSLIQAGWCEEGHPATKNSLQYPWVDGDFPLVVELNLEVWFGCLPWGKGPTLA